MFVYFTMWVIIGVKPSWNWIWKNFWRNCLTVDSWSVSRTDIVIFNYYSTFWMWLGLFYGSGFLKKCVGHLIHASQHRYYCDKLIENKHNFKEIYSIANKLLFRKEPLPLPALDDPTQLANEFNTYFIGKIEKIMAGLEPENPDFLTFYQRVSDEWYLSKDC